MTIPVKYESKPIERSRHPAESVSDYLLNPESGSDSRSREDVRRTQLESDVFEQSLPVPLDTEVLKTTYSEPLLESVPEMPPRLERVSGGLGSFALRTQNFTPEAIVRGSREKSGATSFVGELRSYPQKSVQNGIWGYLHLIRFPPYPVVIRGGSVSLHGLIRTFKAQECLGKFPLQIVFIPYSPMYNAVEVETPARIDVQILLNDPDRPYESFLARVSSPQNLRWIFYPQRVGLQIPPPNRSFVASPKNTNRVFELDQETGRFIDEHRRPIDFERRRWKEEPLMRWQHRIERAGRDPSMKKIRESSARGISPLLITAVTRRMRETQSTYPAPYQGMQHISPDSEVTPYETREYPSRPMTMEEIARSKELLPSRREVPMRPRFYGLEESRLEPLRRQGTFRTPSGRVVTYTHPVSPALRHLMSQRVGGRDRTLSLPSILEPIPSSSFVRSGLSEGSVSVSRLPQRTSSRLSDDVINRMNRMRIKEGRPHVTAVAAEVEEEAVVVAGPSSSESRSSPVSGLSGIYSALVAEPASGIRPRSRSLRSPARKSPSPRKSPTKRSPSKTRRGGKK